MTVLSLSLPSAAMRPLIHLAARWSLSPRINWPTARRRLELAQSFPGPPRGTEIRFVSVGGVPAEELRPSASEATLLVYFHGGGYVVGSPRTHRSLVGRMAGAFGGPALSVAYRLAPEHPYPAALDDARAVWRALIDERGLDPARIVVAGDSAGGGLALALALGLRDAGEPLPAALGLISPWLDLALDADERRPPAPRDVILTRGLLSAFAAAYLAGASAGRAAVSPLQGELAGLPPLVVHTCDEDLIRADGERLVARARAAGVTVTHEDLPGLWHDPHLNAAFMAEPGGGAPLRMARALRAHVAGI
ncbi:MAG: alpha/beta hydrolase [Solirubrobacteraceae bacterium]